MNYDLFTDEAKEILTGARRDALKSRHQEFNSVHIIKYMLLQNNPILCTLLKNSNVEPHKFEERVNSYLSALPKSLGKGEIQMSDSLEQILQKSKYIAIEKNSEFIVPRYILSSISLICDECYKLIGEFSDNYERFQGKQKL